MKHLRRLFALFVLLAILLTTPTLSVKADTPASSDFLNPDGTLRMEALENGTLDLRGWDVNFDSRRGPVFRPLALNGTWSTLGGGLNDDVTAIAVSGSNVYVGGWFTQAGGISANRIAVWNGTTWSALGSGLNNVVTAIAVSGSNVYVGGWFTQAGGISANYVARWDSTTSTWSSLGSGLNNSINLNAMAVSGSNVYVGGWFTQAGGISANHIAVWDSTTSTWSALSSGVNNWVYAIAVSGPNVYVGGWFTQAGGISANRIARWDGTTWSALGSGLNERVYRIAISGSNVYVVGSFTQAGGIPANHIARWDGATWSALGSGLNNYVYAVAVSGSNVYVGGGVFTSAGGVPANRVAVWDSTTSTWSALGNGVDNFVYAITVSGPNVYFGGQFTQAGGVSANHIASFLADPVPPTVIFGTGSVPPSEGANLTTGPSQLVVRFSEDVLGDGSQHAANSGWNYMLLRPGLNGIFDTPIDTPTDPEPICDSDHVAAGDDERIDISTIGYAVGTFTASLTIDPFYAPLANGTYRLYVCGEASVWDLASNPLNGGANTAINFTVGPAATPANSNSAQSHPKLPSTGFAPNRVTLLPSQTLSYTDLGDLWLEVPKLGLKMPIVGVPKKNGQWDVSWLGSNAGWLEDSAYPSWGGNSVLTGHVWNADNSAGPFVYLNTLWWGDKIIVHLSGQQYIYEVRSVKQVAPTDINAMMKHEDLPWLTLVSCKGYNEKTGEYSYRVIVRAVLVQVK